MVQTKLHSDYGYINFNSTGCFVTAVGSYGGQIRVERCGFWFRRKLHERL